MHRPCQISCTAPLGNPPFRRTRPCRGLPGQPAPCQSSSSAVPDQSRLLPRTHQVVPDQLPPIRKLLIQTHHRARDFLPRQAAPCQESPSSTAPACVMGSFPQPPYHEPVFWISCPGHHYFVYERKGCIVFKKIRILTNRIVKDQISRSSVFSY